MCTYLRNHVLVGKEGSIHRDKKAVGDQYVYLAGDEKFQVPLLIDVSGEYRLVMRIRNVTGTGRVVWQSDRQDPLDVAIHENVDFQHVVLAERLYLSAGQHSLTLTSIENDIDVDNLCILPIRNNQNFPLDITHAVISEFYPIKTLFEAEELYQQTGRNVADSAASDKMVRFGKAEQDKPGFIVFGPYQRITVAGEYIARFHLKVSDRTTDQPVAVLDIFSDTNKVLAQRVVNGTDFKDAESYQIFEMACTIPQIYPREVHQLEFRVYFTGKADLWVDSIEFSPITTQ